MDRRAQLAAWVVILVLGVGVGYVATVVRPFPEEDAAWPLRARYTVDRFSGGSDAEQVTRVHEFTGTSWRDWIDVTLPEAEGEPAQVSAFDGRTAQGVLAGPSFEEPFAALEAVEDVDWESVDAVHDQSRAPNDWFNDRFGSEPESVERREVVQELPEWEEGIAEDLGLEPEALRGLEYVEAACADGTVEACGDDVYRYRYVFHEAAGVPLYVEELYADRGMTRRLMVTDVEIGLDEATSIVAQRRPQ